MSNPCSNPITCADGNCIGCKGGVPWCQDPRCAPYCANCNLSANHEFAVNMTVIIILICLIAILFIVWFVYGPQFFEAHADYDRGNVIVPTEYYI